MAVRHLKPTSAGRRWQTVSDFKEITSTKPEKSLLEPLNKKAGRNNNGRITTRHQGGGTKRKYRRIDFKRKKDDVPAKVATIEYDPNRSARIALLHYVDGAKGCGPGWTCCKALAACMALRTGTSPSSPTAAAFRSGAWARCARSAKKA